MGWLEENRQQLGVFYPYLATDSVTDIDYNGNMLWITDSRRGRYKVVNHGITPLFVENFTNWTANNVNRPFNKVFNILEAETGNLRISILHESVAVSGRSICIRKSPDRVRHTEESLVNSRYCCKKVLTFIRNCVQARMNLVFCGEPGVGKTECARFFSRYIPSADRVITIEDTLELHYAQINGGKDCVELKINENSFDYTAAIKASLRQNPKWIMLSEARSREVRYLLECWSTGVYGFTTMHTDDVRKIPDRIMNMIGDETGAGRRENDIYEFVNIGILIRRRQTDDRIERYIDQVCIFSREQMHNKVQMLVEDGNFKEIMLPQFMVRKFKQAKISDPYGISENSL